MSIENVLAGLAGGDLKAARTGYRQIPGRPADSLPPAAVAQ